MKLQLISDGTAHGTRIVNAETGERVDNVTAVSWELDVHSGYATAQVTFVEMPAKLDVHVGRNRIAGEPVRITNSSISSHADGFYWPGAAKEGD